MVFFNEKLQRPVYFDMLSESTEEGRKRITNKLVRFNSKWSIFKEGKSLHLGPDGVRFKIYQASAQV